MPPVSIGGADPGAKLVVLDGGGHFVSRVLRDPSSAAVTAFLRQQLVE